MSPPLALWLHRAVTAAAEPLLPLYFRRRARRGKEDAARLRERFGHAGVARPEGQLVWIHAASVGETISILPLAAALRAGGRAVLVTTGTVTSAAIAAKRLPTGAIHQFAPVDAPAAARRFMAHWRPDAALFVESELWPNLIGEARRAGAALAIVNGRMSARSAKGWSRAPRAIAALLARFDLCLAQSEIDAARFRQLGATGAIACGNLKFDADPLPFDAAALETLRSAIGDRPVFIAASTHPGEEAAAILAHRAAATRIPRLLTIIAPRHAERGGDIAGMAEQAGLKVATRSRGEMPDADAAIYLADTMGELGLVYRLGRLAFVGGSLVEHGGQNPIEAAKLGVGVLHGPHVGNFLDAYAAFDRDGAAIGIDDPDRLGAEVAALLTNRARLDRMARSAQASAASLSGALACTLDALAPLLAGGTGR